MINIKETVKTPSRALQLMVDGLIKQSNRKDFTIDMTTFGNATPYMCFGCAATCAVQQLANKDLSPNHIHLKRRAQYLGFDPIEMHGFEIAIDDARQGNVCRLFQFLGYSETTCKYDDKFDLSNHSWKNEIPKVIEVIEELKKDGF